MSKIKNKETNRKTFTEVKWKSKEQTLNRETCIIPRECFHGERVKSIAFNETYFINILVSGRMGIWGMKPLVFTLG